MVALRTEIATELRGIGGSVHAALEQAMAELAFMKQSLAEVQRTTPDLKPPKMLLGCSVETDVTTPDSQRTLKSSTRCPSGHTFSSSSGVGLGLLLQPPAALAALLLLLRCCSAAAPCPHKTVHRKQTIFASGPNCWILGLLCHRVSCKFAAAAAAAAACACRD